MQLAKVSFTRGKRRFTCYSAFTTYNILFYFLNSWSIYSPFSSSKEDGLLILFSLHLNNLLTSQTEEEFKQVLVRYYTGVEFMDFIKKYTPSKLSREAKQKYKHKLNIHSSLTKCAFEKVIKFAEYYCSHNVIAMAQELEVENSNLAKYPFLRQFLRERLTEMNNDSFKAQFWNKTQKMPRDVVLQFYY